MSGPNGGEARQGETTRPRRGVVAALAVGLALLCALVLTEGALRVVEWRALRAREIHRSGPAGGVQPGAATTLLCAGDSWTYGQESGDPARLSYPAQLQGILDRRLGAGHVRVVNRGLPGANSAELARRLPAMLDEVRPRGVILQVGALNWVDPHRAGSGGDPAWTLRLSDPGAGLLGWSRVVRLGRLLLAPDPSERAVRAGERLAAARREVLALLRDLPGASDPSLGAPRLPLDRCSDPVDLPGAKRLGQWLVGLDPVVSLAAKRLGQWLVGLDPVVSLAAKRLGRWLVGSGDPVGQDPVRGWVTDLLVRVTRPHPLGSVFAATTGAQAMAATERVLTRHPGCVAARVVRAELCLRRGDLSCAERDARAALATAPREPRAAMVLAWSHRLAGGRWPERDVERLDDLWWRYPRYAELHRTLAAAELEGGMNLCTIAAVLSQLQEAHPGLPWVRKVRDAVRRHLGDAAIRGQRNAQLRADLATMVAEVRDARARVMLLTYADRKDRRNPCRTLANDLYRQVSRELGVPLLDISGLLVPGARPGTMGDYGENGHPSARGYAKIAQAVAARLHRLGWLDRRKNQ